jgi:hypothetical protein
MADIILFMAVAFSARNGVSEDFAAKAAAPPRTARAIATDAMDPCLREEKGMLPPFGLMTSVEQPELRQYRGSFGMTRIFPGSHTGLRTPPEGRVHAELKPS